MKHEELFSELRSIAQRTPSPGLWRVLVELIRPLEGEELARFHDETTPYLRRALSHWPDELRVAYALSDPPQVLHIATTLELHARSIDKPIPQRLLGARQELWSSEHCATIRHVRAEHYTERLGEFFHALLTSLRDLESISFAGQARQTTNTRYDPNTPPLCPNDFIDLVVDLHGTTLQRIGLGMMWIDSTRNVRTPTRHMWNRFFARLDDLPTLRALRIENSVSVDSTLTTILSDPRLDGLEELSVVTRIERKKVMELALRPASKNLDRVRIQPISKKDALELIASPNLSNVTCWELETDKPSPKDTHAWGSPRSRYLAARSPFIATTAADVVDTTWLDLTPYSASEVHELLFEDGNLRQLERVEGILARDIGYKDAKAIFVHAHDALPNLKRFVFDVPFIARPRDIRAFGVSPLASKLELFWTRATYLTKKNTHLGGRPDEIIAQRRKWLEIARETRIHSTFRRHAWRCVTSGRGKSESFSICNAIGIKCSKRQNNQALRALINTHTPLDLGESDITLDGNIPDELDPNGGITKWRAANGWVRFEP